MALLPDKVTFKRITRKECVVCRKAEFKYKDSGDIGDEGGTPHVGTYENKCFGCFGATIDFGTDAGLGLDISKKLVVACDQFDVTTGGPSGDKKAEILMPGLITACMEALAPCGSTLVMRIRETGSEEDSWHIRTVEGCGIPCGCACPCCSCTNPCATEYKLVFNITPATSKEKQGTITITSAACFGCLMLASESKIEVDFPSEGEECSGSAKHAILCAAMLLDKNAFASRSWCV